MSATRSTEIYALCEPDTGEVRYVGKTSCGAARRLREHISLSKNHRSHSYNWVRSLVARGLKPSSIILEVVEPGGDWAYAEKKWIAHFRSVSGKLVNQTDGGEGVTGRKYTASAETRAKLSAASLGRQLSDDAKIRKSSALKKHYENDAAYQRRAEFCREINSRPDVKEKQSAAAKKRWANPEFRKRTIAAMQGKKKRVTHLLHGS